MKPSDNSYTQLNACGAQWSSSEYGGDPEFQIAMHAIGNCAFQALYEILLEKPHLVRRKGWSGHTLLHRGCLVGDFALVQLLLQTGADANATNDCGETPLLYACRRGLVGILHLLIQHNGDMCVLDKYGRGTAHHAALSGNVSVLHYLTNVMRTSVCEADYQQQTPLHIVCENGNLDAFNFLLRNSRSNLSQQDANGNTALHIAARQCFGPICWKLLAAGGLEQLSVANRGGQTPLTLCRVNSKPGRAELLPYLEKLSRVGVTSLPYPTCRWYWQCVKPALLYAAIVLLANAYTTTYGSLYMVVPLALLFRSLLSEGHRMPHLCRWPNPVYAGLFAAGIFHNVILYISKIVPVLITNSHKGLVLFSAVLILASLYHYFKLLYMDPGVLKTRPTKASGETSSIVDICHATGRPDTFCVDCEMVREGMTKHCKLCAVCYIHMDHHCLFLAKCIAKYNHRCFVVFLTLMTTSILVFFLNALVYCSHVYPKLAVAAANVTLHDGWLMSLAVANATLLLWMLGYLAYQLRGIADGTTAYFKLPANARQMTMKQRIRNIVKFIIEGRFVASNSVQTV